MARYLANPLARAALLIWNVARAEIGPDKRFETGQSV
jgi:hypothetical protein